VRLAVVSPRYGPEIGGGAEGLARWAATRLARAHDVTVLTTRAIDYRTWEDHYPAGASRDGEVRVLRFGVPEPRDGERFDRFCKRLWGRRPDAAVEERWMREQGPGSPGLLDHLDREGSGYDAVLFVPYVYATTYEGLPLVSDRSVLIPALHDEPAAALRIMDRTFALARGLAFSTPEEQEFCRARFGPPRGEARLVGLGVERPPRVEDAEADEPFVLYLGRVDPSKGCDALLDAHQRAIAEDPSRPRLVLAGRLAMEVPRYPWLTVRGFVSEEEKARLLSGAIATVLPSPYESLSISVLEAWMHGTPAIVTERSPVLVGQVRRGEGGLWYSSAAEYAACLDRLARSPSLAAVLGRQGRRYARSRYDPERVGARLEELVAAVAAR
jgi:glycosyltransferase involved in cell wall biosynthesis